MARIVLPIAGAIIGAYFGNPQLGWAVGSLIAGVAFQETQRVSGPRIDDLKATASSYGAPIPYVFGHPRIGGQVVWASDKREIATTTEQGGKGGPSVEATTYTYEQDMLIKLSCNEMPGGIRRIFSNGKLVWTIGDDADLESVAAAADFAHRVTVYTGDEDQLPDPTYEAAVGVGSAPAYRGALTIFIEGLQLGGSGQTPNLTFEVMSAATAQGATEDICSVSKYTINNVSTFAYTDGDFTEFFVPAGASFSTSLFNRYRVDHGGVVRLKGQLSAYVRDNDAIGNADEPIFGTSSTGGTLALNRYLQAPILVDNADGWRMSRYSKRGDYLVAAVQRTVSTTGRLYRWKLSTDELLTVDLGHYIVTTWVQDGYVYALRRDGTANTVYVLDVDDLSLLQTIPVPSVDGSAEMTVDESGSIYVVDSLQLLKYEDGSWSTHATLPSGYGASGDIDFTVSPHVVNGVLYTTRNINDGTVRVRAAWKGFQADDEALTDVVQAACESAGIDPSDIDTSDLAGLNVRAFAVTPSSARQALEVLGAAYLFEANCSDILRFVRRGGAVAATIPWEDLGAVEAGEDADTGLPITVRNDVEMPAFVVVRYINVLDDYQDGSETSDRLVTQSNAERTVQLALGMTPQEAKRLADALAMDIQASINSVGPIKLQQKWSALEPCDPVIITGEDGSTYRVRFQKRDDSGGVISLEGVFDDATVINSTALTSNDYTSSSTISRPGSSVIELIDGPILRDADDESGFYVAMTGDTAGWPGGSVQKSADNVSFAEVARVTERAVIGVATTALGDWAGPNFVDEINAVTVDVAGSALSSCTHEELLSGAGPVLIIGDEVVPYKTATLVSSGVYRITGMLRGRRGTEWAMSSHAVGDRVVLLRAAGMRRVLMDAGELNLLRYYKGVTFGRTVNSADSVEFTNTGAGKKPFAVKNVRGNRDASDLVISWDRRTRLSENWLAGTLPLGEVSESYEIDIRNAGNTATLRTLTSTTASVTYTAAQQTTDFGSPPASVRVRVYQMSDTVGRGYVTEAVI